MQRERWTDERLDALDKKVNDRFDKIKTEMFWAAVALMVAAIGAVTAAIVAAVISNG